MINKQKLIVNSPNFIKSQLRNINSNRYQSKLKSEEIHQVKNKLNNPKINLTPKTPDNYFRSNLNKLVATVFKEEKVPPEIKQIASASFFLGISVGIIIPTLPSFATSIGLTAKEFGMVISLTQFIRALSTIPANWQIEKIGSQKMMLTGSLQCAIFNSLTGIAWSFYSLSLVRMCTGLFGTFQNLGSSVQINKITEISNRQTSSFQNGFAFGIGFLFGPLIGGAVVNTVGQQSLFFSIGLTQLFMTYFIRYKVRDLGDSSDTSLDLRNLLTKDIEMIKLQYADKNIRTLIYNQGSTSGMFFSSIFTLFPISLTNLGLSPFQVATTFIIQVLLNNISSKVVSKISDNQGRKNLVLLGNFIQALSFLSQSYGTQEALCLSLLLFPIGQSLQSPITAWMTDLTDDKNFRQTNTFAKVSQDLGIALASITTAMSYEQIGLQGTCQVISTVNLINTMLLYRNCKDNQQFSEKDEFGEKNDTN